MWLHCEMRQSWVSLLATRAVTMVDGLPRACKWLLETRRLFSRRAILFYSRQQLTQNRQTTIWLVETQNKILSRIAILSYTSSVQVGRQNGLRIFGGFFFTKMGITFYPEVRFWWELSQIEIPYVSSCMPSEKSGKNLWPENEFLQGFGLWRARSRKCVLHAYFRRFRGSGVPAGSLAIPCAKGAQVS